jgi:hypothetical protein
MPVGLLPPLCGTPGTGSTSATAASPLSESFDVDAAFML